MKQYNFVIFFGIIFGIILNSCSIEKRVYRSGYHIEWKKANKYASIDNSEKNNTGLSAHQNIDFSDSEKVDDTFNKEIQYDNNESSIKEGPALTSILTSEKTIIHSDQVLEENNNTYLPNTKLKNKKRQLLPLDNLKGFNDSGKSGWFFIIAALLLLLLAWVFYAYLGVFGLILGLIFVIGAGIYFIVGIIILIANT